MLSYTFVLITCLVSTITALPYTPARSLQKRSALPNFKLYSPTVEDIRLHRRAPRFRPLGQWANSDGSGII
ncbi:hypothetical protein BATDEDRAFT_91738 [Batrachochytrium dendrobatidis JAM81]|uniref:Uncharacterized protein n=1 Tax=Batrachochytrium dendrobatidis (strain JAM81 / FGSC 10211) TaxID=684364 RepID=F4PBU3_BATDJ|nr:uncharacterized protein BATDEDRAFT_91738 [Batrachochytrium dendrobatidis JAM81]EGF77510.1 hypothetical protein BATDEDRAFT_91738 [Batrachochytrium dendrobatidis JAM81]KAJ8329993.1 hypothetical protein O5D80_001923 [Batrachochytrium dendrobatidis]KAK5669141.1 hypothetical protein QVD99_003552 [Batrachochytrium dendrobatidis]|eukprot:XP_006682102.1 hypothetical protein BATDEDRAFT_91738 [Batrachochytrium dendrobatidis JAM81]